MRNRIFPLGHPDSRGPESHRMDARVGAEFVRRYRDHTAKHELPMFNSISFHGDAVRHLLSQEGAAGVRFSLGITNEGDVTLVGFAVNDAGNVIGSEVMDNGHPCPPWCADIPKPEPKWPLE